MALSGRREPDVNELPAAPRGTSRLAVVWQHVRARENLPYLIAFAIIYLSWGSTFLAMRIGVTHLPPLLFSAGRSLLAGSLLLLLAMQRGEHLPKARREFAFLAFFGIAMITVPNGASAFALTRLHSNEVALLNTSLAFWIVVLGALGPMGQKLPRRSMVGLLLGFCGVAMIVWPHGTGFSARIGWQALALLGCFVWSVATVLYRNTLLGIGPIAFNAFIMLIGGGGLFIGGALSGELPHWHWELPGMLALLYLALVGSALAYTAYAWLLKNARTDRVATFAYVNPAIATLLGWFVLGETLTPLQIVGTLVVLTSVALTTLPTRGA
jgi:drug/metabolite transporter (DMT)-like permease